MKPAAMNASPPPSSRAAHELPADRLRSRLMAASLGSLLDRVRGSREVLPHLAALERGLHTDGMAAFMKVQPHWLRRIASQLGSLPLPDDDTPLQDLLHHVMDLLESERSALDNVPFDMERTVVIEEMSHTDFMAVARADMPTEVDDGRSLDGQSPLRK